MQIPQLFLRRSSQVLSRHSSSYLSPISLVGLDSRWIRLPECEKGAIADHLAKVQQGDWKAMTQEEKRAAYYIAYGPYGPRAPADPAQKILVAGWVAFFLLTSIGLWRYWEAVKPKPITRTKEWQDAQKEKAKEINQNPFSRKD